MKITTKGQVTIPMAIRQKTGLFPGSDVEFVEEKGRVYIQKIDGAGRGAHLVRQMTGRGDVGMSTDEILALTRGNG